MKERNWFIKNGWRYDSRNHCWLQDDINNILESGEKLVESSKESICESHSVGLRNSIKATNSRPFSNPKSSSEYMFIKNGKILIFNNQQYPLKFWEVKL